MAQRQTRLHTHDSPPKRRKICTQFGFAATAEAETDQGPLISGFGETAFAHSAEEVTAQSNIFVFVKAQIDGNAVQLRRALAFDRGGVIEESNMAAGVSEESAGIGTRPRQSAGALRALRHP